VHLPHLCFERNRAELLFELFMTQSNESAKKQANLDAMLSDWTPALSECEQASLKDYMIMWEKEYGLAPELDSGALFAVGQNANERPTVGVMNWTTSGTRHVWRPCAHNMLAFKLYLCGLICCLQGQACGGGSRPRRS
jgi:hypothetical protein